MIGSGNSMGESISQGYAYRLDPKNGMGMQNVVFAHSIDGLLHVLDSQFETVTGTFANRRDTIIIEETGARVPFVVPDQIAVNGTLKNGVFVSSHFRGGRSLATNFHMEINGSEGDLVLTSPFGYLGAGGFRLTGAQGRESLRGLEVPASYGADKFSAGTSQGIAVAYTRLASDIIHGTHLSSTFDDAIALHELINKIEQSAGFEV
jgi:predicted dehydrogenase